jgi:PKD repeat protein
LHFAWSADGRQIAFGAYEDQYSELGYGIYTVHRDGSNVTLVALDAAEPAWAPFAVSASFTVGCTGLTCTFDARHSVGVMNYAWNFGDQTSGTGSVITHTYANAGFHTAELTVTSAAGASSSSSESFLVNLPPVASFTVSCDSSLRCWFDGSASHDPGGSIRYIEWRFGDGTFFGCGGNCSLSAQHTYAAACTYTVTLLIMDDNAASTTVSQIATAVGTPTMHVGDLDVVNPPDHKRWLDCNRAGRRASRHSCADRGRCVFRIMGQRAFPPGVRRTRQVAARCRREVFPQAGLSR